MNALNEQLSDYEIAILVYMMRNYYNKQDGEVLKNDIDQHLHEIGLNDSLKISLAFAHLQRQEMIRKHMHNNLLFYIVDKGINWLIENKNNLESKTFSG